MSLIKKRGCLWWLIGVGLLFLMLFGVLYLYFEESWDIEGTGEIAKVIDGETVEINDQNQTIRIKLAFVDAPSPQSIHGQKAINLIKTQIKYFPKAQYRVKRIGDQYIGEVTVHDWNRSFNDQLITNGLARVVANEKGQWKETTVNSYLKSQELTKNIKRGIWAYEGYVTKDGFHPSIEKQLILQVEQAKQQQRQKKIAQQKQELAYYQSVQQSLEAVKEKQPNIAYIQYEDNPKKRGTYSYTLWVNVYVIEEKWANMTLSQKLSMIVTSEKEIKDRIHQLSSFKQGGTTIVRYFSDTAKDEIAEKKLLRLRGHEWRILR